MALKAQLNLAVLFYYSEYLHQGKYKNIFKCLHTKINQKSF